MSTQPVPVPVFKLIYDRADITAELTPFLLAISFSDNLDGKEGDSLEVTLEDTDARWWDRWYPTMGDRLALEIGYQGAPLYAFGAFRIDEIEIDMPPSTVRIKALAASPMLTLRTHTAAGYEDTTLAGIVDTVAGRHGLTVVGEIEPIKVRRVTQMHEDDLAFLRRVGKEYGYAFNVRGDQLVFENLRALRDKAAVAVLHPHDLSRASIRDKIKGVPQGATVGYHSLKMKKLVASGVDQEGNVVEKPSADRLKLNTRAESQEQAQVKAQAALDAANDEATTARVTLAGDPRLIAGVNVELTGFGKLSGNYQIKGSRHELSRGSGYTTDLELSRAQLKTGSGAATPITKLRPAGVDQEGKVIYK